MSSNGSGWISRAQSRSSETRVMYVASGFRSHRIRARRASSRPIVALQSGGGSLAVGARVQRASRSQIMTGLSPDRSFAKRGNALIAGRELEPAEPFRAGAPPCRRADASAWPSSGRRRLLPVPPPHWSTKFDRQGRAQTRTHSQSAPRANQIIIPKRTKWTCQRQNAVRQPVSS